MPRSLYFGPEKEFLKKKNKGKLWPWTLNFEADLWPETYDQKPMTRNLWPETYDQKPETVFGINCYYYL